MNFNSRGPGHICLLFDSAIGGGGTTANQTTQTTSGNGRTIGNKNQYTESGAISVGPKGKYQEAGSLDASGSSGFNSGLAGSNISLQKGATLNITQPLTGMAATGQPIAALTAAPGTVPTTTAPTPAPAADPSSSAPSTSTASTSALWQSIKDHWAAWSTWQKVGAGVAGALIVWLIFHRRRAS